MPKPAALSYEQKMYLLGEIDGIVKDEDFITLRVSRAMAQPVEWERGIDLDAYRRNEGRSRAILPVVVGADPASGEKATKALIASVKTRLGRVYPKESWTLNVFDGQVWLKYNGDKKPRVAG